MGISSSVWMSSMGGFFFSRMAVCLPMLLMQVLRPGEPVDHDGYCLHILGQVTCLLEFLKCTVSCLS
jgi:hypothetical protein